MFILYSFSVVKYYLYYLKILLSVEYGWTLTQKPCGVVTDRKGESRQLVVGVPVRREILMCGTDKTLVCCAPVRPAHLSHATPGR